MRIITSSSVFFGNCLAAGWIWLIGDDLSGNLDFWMKKEQISNE
jgi:hypothetical protein